MIDIHSHILPGVDDGVQSMADALQMLQIAAADGVTVQVLTPHIQPGRFDNTPAALQTEFESLRRHVADAGIDIELALAAEVHLTPQIMNLVGDGTLPLLGEFRGMQTFLLEFPLSRAPAGSINLVDWLLARGILPVIAHPERCREWQDDPQRLQPYIDAGCLLQITAGSVLGAFGSSASRMAATLLERDQVAAMASDCHNLAYRPPGLSEARDQIAQQFDEQLAMQLTVDGPAALLGRAGATAANA